MSKICILGDTHMGMRSDSLDFHRYNEKFYETVFFPYLIENKISKVYQLGDLFDRRKFINFQSLHLSRKYFFDNFQKNNIELHTLLGNHCIFFRNTLEVNSTSLLIRDYKNIHIYDKFTTVNENGISIDIVPWICEENEKEILEQIKKSKSEICFGHFDLADFEMDRGTVQKHGMDRRTLSKYDVVLSGHFHHKSSQDSIHYVGIPVEMTWIDFDDPKGFHIFDTNTREMEFIRNPYRMFQKIIYDDETDEQDFDYSSLKDTYVKVIVVNKQNPYLFDKVMDNVLKSGAIDVNVVEDFTDIKVVDDEEVDQKQDTVSILNTYIDNLELTCDAEKLKTLMREVYVEALNLEKTLC